jgi:hypothetical protein
MREKTEGKWERETRARGLDAVWIQMEVPELTIAISLQRSDPTADGTGEQC